MINVINASIMYTHSFSSIVCTEVRPRNVYSYVFACQLQWSQTSGFAFSGDDWATQGRSEQNPADISVTISENGENVINNSGVLCLLSSACLSPGRPGPRPWPRCLLRRATTRRRNVQLPRATTAAKTRSGSTGTDCWRRLKYGFVLWCKAADVDWGLWPIDVVSIVFER